MAAEDCNAGGDVENLCGENTAYFDSISVKYQVIIHIIPATYDYLLTFNYRYYDSYWSIVVVT